MPHDKSVSDLYLIYTELNRGPSKYEVAKE